MVVERETHIRALELRFEGIPMPLLLHILTFVPGLPDRMSSAAVCRIWSEAARHKLFKRKARTAP